MEHLFTQRDPGEGSPGPPFLRVHTQRRRTTGDLGLPCRPLAAPPQGHSGGHVGSLHEGLGPITGGVQAGTGVISVAVGAPGA